MDYATEFQRRRHAVFWRSLPWIGGGIVTGLAVMLVSAQSKSTWMYYAPQLMLALIWLAVVVRVGYIAKEHFRCPKCNRSIWLDGGEYVLDPASCPKCGIALKSRGSAPRS